MSAEVSEKFILSRQIVGGEVDFAIAQNYLKAE